MGKSNGPGKSASVVKRSLLIAGHATSISLEDAFWTALKSAATGRGQSVAALVAAVDAGRGDATCHRPSASFFFKRR